MIYLMHKTFSNYFEAPKFWVILIAFLLLLFTVLLFEIDLRNRQHLLEKEALSKHLLEEKYQNLNEVYSQNARLYHDLNNHLIALDHLLDDGNIPEAKTYIAAIQKPVQILKKTHWTGDDVVDAVLNNKIQLMENRNIHYEIQTDFPDKTGIEAADLCTILANLLDNAIEATDVVLMDDDPAKIALAMRIARRTLRIVYENIVFALAVKFACLLLGAIGMASMWTAIFADVGVMVIAVLNATRALYTKDLVKKSQP